MAPKIERPDGSKKEQGSETKSNTNEKRSEDLYSVHNFDLDINIPVTVNGMMCFIFSVFFFSVVSFNF